MRHTASAVRMATDVLAVVGVAAISCVAAWGIFRRGVAAQEFITILVLLLAAAASLQLITRLNNQIQESTAAAFRIQKFMATPTEPVISISDTSAVLERHHQSIEIEHVSYSYPGYYKFGTSSIKSLSARPNEFLMWQAIKLAHSLGCHRLDLGLSDIDQPGLIRFKQQLGAEEKKIRFLRYSPTSVDNRSTPSLYLTLGDLTRLYTDPSVPDNITAQAGELMYPLFA